MTAGTSKTWTPGWRDDDDDDINISINININMNDHVNDVPLQLHLSHLPQSQDRCLGAKQAHRSSRQPQLLNLDAAKTYIQNGFQGSSTVSSSCQLIQLIIWWLNQHVSLFLTVNSPFWHLKTSICKLSDPSISKRQKRQEALRPQGFLDTATIFRWHTSREGLQVFQHVDQMRLPGKHGSRKWNYQESSLFKAELKNKGWHVTSKMLLKHPKTRYTHGNITHNIRCCWCVY